MDSPASFAHSRSPSRSRSGSQGSAGPNPDRETPQRDTATPEPYNINVVEQYLLDCAAEGDTTEAFMLLERNQVRRVPPSVCLEQLKPPSLLGRWGMSCMDVSNLPGSWTSQDMCERCAAINQIMRARRTDSRLTSMTQCLLGTALATTDCASRQLSGIIPSLPLEIIVMVMDFYLDDYVPFAAVNLERPGNVTSGELMLCMQAKAHLCDTLQSSSFLRSRIAMRLPMPIINMPLGRARKGRTGPSYNYRYDNLHKALGDFVPEAIEWYVKDGAAKRHALHQLVLPSAVGNVTMGKNKLVHSIKWTVKVATVDPTHTMKPDSEDKKEKVGEAERSVVKLKSQPLTVRNACEVLAEALRAVTPVARILSPFHRIRKGDDPQSGVVIDVTMELPEYASSKSRVSPKQWRFRVFTTEAGAQSAREKIERAAQRAQAQEEASPAAPAQAPAQPAAPVQQPAAAPAQPAAPAEAAAPPALSPSPPGSPPPPPPPPSLPPSPVQPNPPSPPGTPPPAPGASHPHGFPLDPALLEDAGDPTAA